MIWTLNQRRALLSAPLLALALCLSLRLHSTAAEQAPAAGASAPAPIDAKRTSTEVSTGQTPASVVFPKVYIGTVHGWSDLNNHPDQWSYVRANADGFYANFIQLLPTVGDPGTLCKQTEALMTHKNAYFESDSRYTDLGGFPDGGQFTLATEAQEMKELLDAGFTIAYSSLNYGVDDRKLEQCKTFGLPIGITRPCLRQDGPWMFGSDINKDVADNVTIRRDMARTSGASTDGPMQLWVKDDGGMQEGSASVVKYARSLNKLSVVMVSPGDLPAAQWLASAQQCVRYHEDQGAFPDIWADYAYDTQTPTVPEANADGSAANTVTGEAYWLLHHLTDPAHNARLTLMGTTSELYLHSLRGTLAASVREVEAVTGTTPVERTLATFAIPVTRLANGRTSATQVVNLTLHNESAWLDLIPVLYATIDDPGHHWTVGFRLGGKDITQAVVQKGGFVFVKDQRLWPKTSKPLQMVLTCADPSGASIHPVSVRVGLLANPARRDKLTQTLTIHGAISAKAAMLPSSVESGRL